MEETMTAAATPSEQPMDHTQTPNAGEPADVPAEDTTIESAEGQASNGAPPLSGTPTGEEATEPDDAGETEGERTEKDADVPVVPDAYTPIYNGEVVRIEASDTEKVTTLLQKGMKYDSCAPMIADLRALAAAADFKTPAELVHKLLENYEKSQYDAMKKKGYEEEHVQKLLDTWRRERQEKIAEQDRQEEQAQLKARQTLEEKLAAQYADLKSEIPDVPAFDKLPRQVVENAVQKGMSLFESYLRFERAEQKRIQEAQESERAASAASAGNLHSEAEPTESDTTTAMLRGLQMALG